MENGSNLYKYFKVCYLYIFSLVTYIIVSLLL